MCKPAFVCLEFKYNAVSLFHAASVIYVVIGCAIELFLSS